MLCRFRQNQRNYRNPESVDLSDNVEYQKVTAEIGMAEEALKQMNNGSEERFILRNKRNGLLNEISDKKSHLSRSRFLMR